MIKLIDLTVDLSALLVRDAGDAEEAAGKYNDLLDSLEKITSIDWIDACVAYDMYTYTDLINDRIRHTFDKPEVCEFDSYTIINRVFGLLAKLQPPFDRDHDIIIQVSCVSTDPDLFIFTADENHRSKMAEYIASSAVLNKIYDKAIPRTIMLLGFAPAPVVEATSDIVFVFSEKHDTSTMSLPCRIESDIQVCDDEIGFMAHIDNIDAEAVLLNASTVEDIHLAVRLALFNRDPKMKNVEDWDSIPVPNIGGHFLAECNKILKSAKVGTCAHLLKALVEVASGELTGTYEIRDVRSVGDLKPWRKRVGGSHRLNFWLGPGKKIEIAWFSEKQKSEKTPYIPDPTVLR